MTSFTIDVPEPVSFDATQAIFHTLASGTALHRIHSNKFGSTQFNATHFGNARFSPIKRRDGTIIPTIYAGETFECAVSEIILRSPDLSQINPVTGARVNVTVRPYKWRDSMHSALESAHDLNLVDLTIKGQRCLGVDRNALLAGPTSTYEATRAWAEAIYEGCPAAHGVYYTSHQLGPEFAVMLFGDRAPTCLTSRLSRPVSDITCDREIRSLASAFGFFYEDL
jgi:hypothetical protein